MAISDNSALVYYVYILFDWCGWPFYVGKGKGRRFERHAFPANRREKNLRNEMIAETIRILGRLPGIKIAQGLTEAQAYDLEKTFISAIGRLPNGPLVNRTGGGGGKGGYTPQPHVIEKLRARMTPEYARAIASYPCTEERKQLLREKLANRQFSTETREKISTKLKERWKDPAYRAIGPNRRGAKHTPEAKEKMRNAQRPPYVRTQAHIDASERRRNIPRSPEIREKISKALRARRDRRKVAAQTTAESDLPDDQP